MINAYMQPAGYEAVNTYTPIPFQELMAAGMTKQKQYEEADAITQDLETNLESQAGLKEISVPGSGTPLEVGDYARVETRKKYYNDMITDLTLNTPDKGSPMYRSKITNVIKQMRKDLSPEGVFGVASANRQSYAETIKEIRSSEDAAANPWLLQGKRQSLIDFANRSKQEVARYDNSSPIGKDPEVNRRLADIMKNIEPELLKSYANEVSPGEIRSGKLSAVTRQRAYEVALGLIANDPTIQNAITTKASWDRDVNGSDIDPNKAADNLASTMAELFAKSEGSTSLDLNAGWASRNDEQQMPGIEVPVNYNVEGTGIGSYSALTSTIEKKNADMLKAAARVADLRTAKEKGAKTIDDQSGKQLSIDDAIADASQYTDELRADLANTKELEKTANRVAGLDPGTMRPEDKAYGEKRAREIFNTIVNKGASKEKEAEREQYVADNWLNYVPGAREAMKKRNAFLEGTANTRTVNANIIIDNEKNSKLLNEDRTKSALLKGKLEWAETTDGKKGELDLATKEKIAPTNSVYVGFGVTPEGKFEYYYDAYTAGDKNKLEKIGTVRVKGSTLDERSRILKGQMDAPGVGIRGTTERAAVVTKGKGYGDFEFSNGKKVTITDPLNEGDPYRILLPKKDDPTKNDVIQFNSLQERNMYLHNIEQSQKDIKQ